ncbi:hypothetical protein C7S18_03620 [Ahniella affigens]|uniref:Calcium-binding protein n=1 Tax=Ahniella affigens TaxID=2021234 RepID=A0A2P1PNC3_9GAMM|nr:PD40 domain-containing protein [Ahniella affigens]AVP96332.1 hypothetical protein C7S18_03620 [Ahniella affigens]
MEQKSLWFALATTILGMPHAAADTPYALVSAPAFADLATSTGESRNPRSDDTMLNVVFESTAGNLVSGDSNRLRDVFLWNASGLMLVSTAGGTPANGDSSEPDISHDGEWIVFTSAADNLVPGDQNGVSDLFVFRQSTGALQRLTPPGGEANGPSYGARMSAGGQRIVFLSAASNWVAGDQNGLDDAFLYDLTNQSVTRVSVSDSGSEVTDAPPSHVNISADGICVSIESLSAQYVSGDTNFGTDYFIRNTQTGVTTRMSVGNAGEQLVSVASANHQLRDCQSLIFYAFPDSAIPGFEVGGYYFRQISGTTRLPLIGFEGTPGVAPVLSPNRTILAAVVPNAASGGPQQQRYNLNSWNLQFSTTAFGTPAAVSGDGASVISVTERPVSSADRNALSDVMLRVEVLGQQEWLSRPMDSQPPRLAANGNSGVGVGIYSNTNNLRRRHHAISGDGRYVLFSSLASNLVPNDTNQVEDVFLRDRQLGQTTRISLTNQGEQTTLPSAATDLSADGRYALFESCEQLSTVTLESVCDLYARRLDVSGMVLDRINVSSEGDPADLGGNPGTGHWGRISGDGRFVAFMSEARNLVPGQDTRAPRVYLRDRDFVTTSFLGRGSRPAISRDGRFVVWVESGFQSLGFYDRVSNAITSLPIRSGGGSVDDGLVDWPTISDSGRYIAYMSDSNQLVPEDNDSSNDVFVFDRVTATNTLVSREDGILQGIQGGTVSDISGDGLTVAYITDNGLTDPKMAGVLVDWQTGMRRWFAGPDVVRLNHDFIARPRISADGNSLVFGVDNLDADQIDLTGDLYDTYVTPAGVDRVFINGFE